MFTIVVLVASAIGMKPAEMHLGAFRSMTECQEFLSDSRFQMVRKNLESGNERATGFTCEYRADIQDGGDTAI
jgi:hypothetical protein